MRPVTSEDTVDVLDLDHTLLATRALMQPVLDRVARVTGLPPATVASRFAAENGRGFSIEGFVRATEVPEAIASELCADLEADVAGRAERFLYPGVAAMLRRRRMLGARQAMVTAGDEPFQRWKFATLVSLQEIFEPEDRHYVPVTGSKAARIALYRHAGAITFVDDKPEWHEEARQRVPAVRLVRTVWPGSSTVTEHPGDGRFWDVACNAAEIERLLPPVSR